MGCCVVLLLLAATVEPCAARWHRPVVERVRHVDALRRRTTFYAQLETFVIGALFGDVARDAGGERQVAAHLAHDQHGGQVASVNLHVTARFLLDDSHGRCVFQQRSRRRQTAFVLLLQMMLLLLLLR